MTTIESVLPLCPDCVPWCTAHGLTVDAVVDPPAIYNDHRSRAVEIPTTSPGVPYRKLVGHLGGSGEGVLARVHAFGGSMDRPMIAVTINPATSGSPDLLWATAEEARTLAGELVRVADLIDGKPVTK